MSDDVTITPQAFPPLRRNPVEDPSEGLARFVTVWNGALHEFRNHLTVLLAAATELRASLPASLSADFSEAVSETERNVQSLSSLIAQLDAAVKGGDPLVSELDEIMERALRIAAPALGRTASVAVRMGRKTGVRNRGAALECLLSTLLVDLGRAAEVKAGERPHHPKLEVHIDVGRAGLVVEIESNGAAPPTSSWRLALANELAAKLDAKVTPHPQTAGYVVQFQ